MSRLSRRLDQVVSGLTLAVGWIVILTLIPLMLFHVLGRQVQDVRSEALAEIAADLFFVLVMLSFGYTYLRDGHVRVDVLRHRLGPAWTARLEIVGCVTILLPLSGILIIQGLTLTWLAFKIGEQAVELPYQWIVRAAVPLGFLLLLLAGVSIVIQNALFLAGAEVAPAPRADDGTAFSPVRVTDQPRARPR
jgi:TRAP-type mannitol/chloroaromatic compound transport system permease small subunit